MGHPILIDHLMHQHVGALGQPDEIRASGSIPGKHYRSVVRVKAVGQCREHRGMIHKNGGDFNPVILEKRERFHAWSRGTIGVGQVLFWNGNIQALP
ncbi:hypothetical protein D3C74_457230 [compost metagenome]